MVSTYFSDHSTDVTILSVAALAVATGVLFAIMLGC